MKGLLSNLIYSNVNQISVVRCLVNNVYSTTKKMLLLFFIRTFKNLWKFFLESQKILKKQKRRKVIREDAICSKTSEDFKKKKKE